METLRALYASLPDFLDTSTSRYYYTKTIFQVLFKQSSSCKYFVNMYMVVKRRDILIGNDQAGADLHKSMSFFNILACKYTEHL